MFFPGFTLMTGQVPGGAVRYRIGGAGPALLLLHGSPQTHAMWHATAPALARRFTVICPDLRGYGGSAKPDPGADHAAYAKARAAEDVADLMTQLGHATFAVAGHDRGAKVAHRLALAAPGRVTRLAVLDAVPTVATERDDMAFALGYYYACWFAQAHPFAEDLIGKGPNTWFSGHTGTAGIPPFFAPDALADYLRAADDPRGLMAMKEDYLATATIDVAHDRISRALGETLQCPVHVLWGARGKIGGWYDPVAAWQDFCARPVTGHALGCGHFLPEEAPDAVIHALEGFLSG